MQPCLDHTNRKASVSTYQRLQGANVLFLILYSLSISPINLLDNTMRALVRILGGIVPDYLQLCCASARLFASWARSSVTSSHCARRELKHAAGAQEEEEEALPVHWADSKEDMETDHYHHVDQKCFWDCSSRASMMG